MTATATVTTTSADLHIGLVAQREAVQSQLERLETWAKNPEDGWKFANLIPEVRNELYKLEARIRGIEAAKLAA